MGSKVRDFWGKTRDEWGEEEAYGFYNYICHELWRAGHARDAAARAQHLEVVRGFDLSRATPEVRAIVAAAMVDHPDAEELMSSEDVALARAAVPIDPPILLRKDGLRSERFMRLGVVM